MKTAASNVLIKALLGGMLLGGAAVIPVAAETQGVVHSITGSGLTVVKKDSFGPGSEAFSFRQSISAWQKADGTVGGNIVVHLWLPSSPEPVVLIADITCLNVIGKTAYSSAIIRSSSNLGFAKPGDPVLGFVTDTDGNGPDISWSGPAIFFLPPGQDCSARPPMPQVPVASGNFVVR